MTEIRKKSKKSNQVKKENITVRFLHKKVGERKFLTDKNNFYTFYGNPKMASFPIFTRFSLLFQIGFFPWLNSDGGEFDLFKMVGSERQEHLDGRRCCGAFKLTSMFTSYSHDHDQNINGIDGRKFLSVFFQIDNLFWLKTILKNGRFSQSSHVIPPVGHRMVNARELCTYYIKLRY